MESTDTIRTDPQVKLRLAKSKFTRAAMAAIAGAPNARELTTEALADLETAFALIRASDAGTEPQC